MGMCRSTETLPDPASRSPICSERETREVKALHYMDLPARQAAGGPRGERGVHRKLHQFANLGSTERRRESLLKGRKVSPNVRVMVVPGSQQVKRTGAGRRLAGSHLSGRPAADGREAGMLDVHRDERRSCCSRASIAFRRAIATSKAGRARAAGPSWRAPLTAAAASAITGVVTDVRRTLL